MLTVTITPNTYTHFISQPKWNDWLYLQCVYMHSVTAAQNELNESRKGHTQTNTHKHTHGLIGKTPGRELDNKSTSLGSIQQH